MSEFSETYRLDIEHMPAQHLPISERLPLALDWSVPVFTTDNPYVPLMDPDYHFDPDTTRAIAAGFCFNRRVLVQGLHGTGKSTHIEQVASRLGWPCMRINLDGYITRLDLIGRDGVRVTDGKQVTFFQEGILPWSLRRPICLIFDEYDAARPDVLFVLQRVLERQGKLTLVEQNTIITPHPYFRLFATANTIGLGDATGLYHGTHAINQGQMDRWDVVTSLNYITVEQETQIITSKVPQLDRERYVAPMVQCAQLIRRSFASGDISSVMSPRSVLSWAENTLIFDDVHYAFRVTFLNKCDETERSIIAEYYQRCFAHALPELQT